MGDKSKGLMPKYDVKRLDGKELKGGSIVLEWGDPNAREGIRAFSEAVREDGYEELANDLDFWLIQYGTINPENRVSEG